MNAPDRDACAAAASVQALAELCPVLVASPDLRRALQALQRFLPRQAPLLRAELREAEGGAWWTLAVRTRLGEGAAALLDHGTGVFAEAVHLVCGRPLCEAVPGDGRVGEPLGEPGGTPGRAWWLPDALLDHRAEGGSVSDFAAAWQLCEAREQAEQADPARAHRTAQTDRWLRSGGEPTLDALAARLGLNPRTLIRHLAREGSSFQVRLDLWRREQALALLRDTDLPVAEIAARLGYRSATNFSRCLRRWFGTTPGALRERAAERAPPAAGVHPA